MSINRFQTFVNPGQIEVDPYELPFNELFSGLILRQKYQDESLAQLDEERVKLDSVQYHPEDEELVYQINNQLNNQIDELSNTDLSRNKSGVKQITSQVRDLYGPKGLYNQISSNYNTWQSFNKEVDEKIDEEWWANMIKGHAEKQYKGGVGMGKSYNPSPISEIPNVPELLEKYGDEWKADVIETFGKPFFSEDGSIMFKNSNTHEKVDINEVMSGLTKMLYNDPKTEDFLTSYFQIATNDMTPEDRMKFQSNLYNVFQLDENGKAIKDPETGDYILNPANPFAEAIYAEGMKQGYVKDTGTLDWRVNPWLEFDGGSGKASGLKSANPKYTEVRKELSVSGENLYLEPYFIDRNGNEVKDVDDFLINLEDYENILTKDPIGLIAGKYKDKGILFAGIDFGSGDLQLEQSIKFPTDLDYKDPNFRMPMISDMYELNDFKSFFKKKDGSEVTDEEVWEITKDMDDWARRYNAAKSAKQEIIKLAKEKSKYNLDTHTLETIEVNEENKNIKSTSLYKKITNKKLKKSTYNALNLNSNPISQNTLDSYAGLQYNIISNIDNYFSKDILGTGTGNIQHKEDIKKAYNLNDKQLENLLSNVENKEDLKNKLLNLPSSKHLEEAIKKTYYSPLTYTKNKNFQEAYDELKDKSLYNYNVFTTLPAGSKEYTAEQLSKQPSIVQYEYNLYEKLSPNFNSNGEYIEGSRGALFDASNITLINDMNWDPKGWEVAFNVKKEAGVLLSNSDKSKFSGVNYLGTTKNINGQIVAFGELLDNEGKPIRDENDRIQYVTVENPELEKAWWENIANTSNPLYLSEHINQLVEMKNDGENKYMGKGVLYGHNVTIYKGGDRLGNKYKAIIYDDSNKKVDEQYFKSDVDLGLYFQGANSSVLNNEESPDFINQYLGK